eukprot:CAMPEP_0114503420 /NCGR_PEP_ID=MMETSP0109-20121206/9636_1 /TAXON_ID=29199 /ORGANISM="Chlorarachnion reptans, Strain CCCM449" /LENGTH=105 /DNA_ID=CAMNT_0001681443 /DNA_START=893 /DNA_END=1205 /DNA_ORIENTATION=-
MEPTPDTGKGWTRLKEAISCLLGCSKGGTPETASAEAVAAAPAGAADAAAAAAAEQTRQCRRAPPKPSHRTADVNGRSRPGGGLGRGGRGRNPHQPQREEDVRGG